METAKDTETVAVDLSKEEALPLLQKGKITGGQLVPWSSNHIFLVEIDAGVGRSLKAVYKPRDGEQPLEDFPSGTLYKREYAAYLLSRNLGWPEVPLTLIRDGPYGIGSVQLYIEADPQATYFDLVDEYAEELMRAAVFDVLANNADRKAGHFLLDNDKRIWSIDHGLTFHSIFKLRTVMLEYWGAQIPKLLLDDLGALAGRLDLKGDLATSLAELLNGQEIIALRRRIDAMLSEPVIPRLDPRRNVPWPLV